MSQSPVNPLTQQPIDDAKLQSLAGLAKQQLVLEGRIAKGEELLAQLNEQLKELKEKRIPDAMAEIGMESFSLNDGSSIIVEKYYAGSISEEHRKDAFAWLRGHDFDSLIKRNVSVTFGKGEDAYANRLVMNLRRYKRPLQFTDKEGVHPQTLKAFIREQMESGNDLPTDLFGVFVGSRAKITPATK